MNDYVKAIEGDLEKAVEFFRKDIAQLRTGRAHPSMLDGIAIDVYGARTPLIGLATISISDSRSLTVAPWDKSLLKTLEKAINDASLGFSVSNEGDRLRLVVPQMTEEIRREMVKKLNEKMETARISARQTRDEAKGSIEAAFADKEVTEDDKFRFLKELDEAITATNDRIKEVREAKEKEIMTI